MLHLPLKELLVSSLSYYFCMKFESFPNYFPSCMTMIWKFILCQGNFELLLAIVFVWTLWLIRSEFGPKWYQPTFFLQKSCAKLVNILFIHSFVHNYLQISSFHFFICRHVCSVVLLSFSFELNFLFQVKSLSYFEHLCCYPSTHSLNLPNCN